MVRPGFHSLEDRRQLEACVRRHRQDHGIAWRANALLLLDDGGKLRPDREVFVFGRRYDPRTVQDAHVCFLLPETTKIGIHGFRKMFMACTGAGP
mgnify:CR=1 FL=1